MFAVPPKHAADDAPPANPRDYVGKSVLCLLDVGDNQTAWLAAVVSRVKSRDTPATFYVRFNKRHITAQHGYFLSQIRDGEIMRDLLVKDYGVTWVLTQPVVYMRYSTVRI
jgi:hypothetical protein